MAKKDGFSPADREYMQRALDLAVRARGRTAPNSMVGAVIVREGVIVGEGYHRRAGGDHAEISALKKAGPKAEGAVIYVTLEPCCHTGLTGPCTDRLIKAGIKKVIYAIKDPDPRVNGRGAKALATAGLEVSGGLLKEAALRINEIYFGNLFNNRPFIILKTVQSLDGRIATATGASRWLSGTDSLDLAHQLRAEVDAVVVGAGTVRADNPALTVRRVAGKNPYRIIISGSLRIPPHCRLLNDNKDYRTILVSSGSAIARFTGNNKMNKPVIWKVKKNRDGHIDLHDFVAKATQFGLRSLLVEGGAKLVTSFLKAGLWDKYVIITTPLVIGRGIEAVGDLAVKKLSQAITFEHEEITFRGRDTVFIGYQKRDK
ncbi:MAG: bifunctional diaminohydroxyphosphoribosylaminopyrimidine deaminase/5-amino-6-(5-phosphoribosylamino)uracil reductase RibD [candidate division Zixibacteria bacterium]|nr:bifunctional diaminohydroxyphosphoribosylaminopyrimidine deaminase/5-amino-6-(5-phosphoribosylamino)uracil reductase RibD [candidate division Zixibacteria bacterium]MDD5425362.1 bifunctional diaminohydroxyphosphoribosylaminopyrimidine deaminase/5-amino-6-(5-phosphoribosylamino)uracil reductase RibD [candidate division Zixibacteria bacterium]